MKFIIPNYDVSDNFTNNVAYTLLKMGHEVITVPKPSLLVGDKFMHLLQLGYDKFMPTRLSPQEQWLRKVHREYKPDVVLALTQEIREDLLLELRQAGALTIAWWGDTPANMRKQGLLVKGWDLVFMKDSFAVAKMRTLGMDAHYLPEAMNPDWHTKCYKTINDSLCFAGNVYGYRHFLIRRLVDMGFTDIGLYGMRPPKWAAEEVRSTYKGRYIVKEEKSRIFGESLACINSTSMSEGNTLNCRAFEIAGAAGLQIIEDRPAVADCFEPGKEILTFNSLEELKELVMKYRTDRKAAIGIRESGHLRANAHHTYEHRLKAIIEHLEK